MADEGEAVEGEAVATGEPTLSDEEKGLLEFCFSGDNAFVKTLLLKGVSVQAKGLKRGITGLHCAAGTGRIDVREPNAFCPRDAPRWRPPAPRCRRCAR